MKLLQLVIFKLDPALQLLEQAGLTGRMLWRDDAQDGRASNLSRAWMHRKVWKIITLFSEEMSENDVNAEEISENDVDTLDRMVFRRCVTDKRVSAFGSRCAR